MKKEKPIDELVGMSLKEALGYIDSNIKLGMCGGNAYVYCGDSKVLKSNLHFVNEKVKKASDKRLDAAIARVRAMIKSENAGLSGYLKRCAWGLEKIEEISPTPEGFMEYVSDYMEKTVKAARAVIPHRNMVESFKPLGERKIVRVYKSISELNTICVLIDGKENGWFWDIGECTRAWRSVDGKLRTIRGVTLEYKEEEDEDKDE